MLPRILPVDTQLDQPPRPRAKLIGPLAGPAANERETLGEALLEHSSTRPGRRTFQFLSASFIQILVLTMAVLLPLMYTETIDLRQFTTTLLVAPPPSPPPPPAPAMVKARPTRAPKRVFSVAGKLQAPATVPQKIAMLKEESLPSEFSGGVAGGVPGGVPGGQLGGVLGGIIGGVASSSQGPTHFVEPPPRAAAKAPVRVGGNLSPPRQIRFQQPYYPPLARQARIRGEVTIDALIDTEGHVVEMKAISGHPLLIEEALKAVSQWRYEPTRLNGEPVMVQFVVTVHFRLS